MRTARDVQPRLSDGGIQSSRRATDADVENGFNRFG
jgi:hypothetical protein